MKKRRPIVLQTTFAVFLLGLWYFGHLLDPLAFPHPGEVVDAFVVQLTQERLIDAMINALKAIFTGFFFAVVSGVPIGLLMGLNKHAERFLNPYVNALYATPFSALVPALILWFGTGFQIRAIVSYSFALFPIIINTLEGAEETPDDLIDVARSFGASYRFLVPNVVIPHEIPYLVAGFRLGIARAVKGLVVVEILVSVTGFGSILATWSSGYQMEGVFSVVFVLMAMGVVLTGLLRLIEDRLVHWDVSTY